MRRGDDSVRHRIAEAFAHSSRVLIFSAVACALSVGLLAGVTLQKEILTPRRWNPLGEYTTQRVTSRAVKSVPGPSAYAPGVVDVTATKCNATSRPVQARTDVSWQRISPLPSVRVPVPPLTATRLPGCSAIDYRNVIPDAVVDLTTRTGRRAIWRVTGVETPVRHKGTEEGVPRAWVTQNFVLVVR